MFLSLLFSDVITRLAFQSLQLVVTDYLPIIPCWCLQVLVEVVGKFGLQPNEINISLTAIGLLVNKICFVSKALLLLQSKKGFMKLTIA